MFCTNYLRDIIIIQYCFIKHAVVLPGVTSTVREVMLDSSLVVSTTLICRYIIFYLEYLNVI